MIMAATVLSIAAGAAWAWFGFLYARMSWARGAPENDSWKRARAVLVAVMAASVVLTLLKSVSSVHAHAVGSAALGLGVVVGACGVITGQLHRRSQMRSHR